MQRELEHLLEETPAHAREREATAFDRLAEGRPLLLYGAGNLGRKTLSWLRREGIEPVGFVDANRGDQLQVVDGVEILGLHAAAERYGTSGLFVITVFNHFPFRTLIETLHNLGCENVVSFIPMAWKYFSAMLPNYAVNLPHLVLERVNAVRDAFRLFTDDYSRKEYTRQVQWRLFGDFTCLDDPVRETAYFPTGLFSLRSDEMFIDCGAYNGDTVTTFLQQTGLHFRGIVACEPDPVNYRELCALTASLQADVSRRIVALPYAVGAKRDQVRFSANNSSSSSFSASGDIDVEVRSLDELIASDRPSYIKMDIEGAELDALKGAATVLSTHRPVMAVCVYHQQAHLWDIPLYLQSFLPDYDYFLRRYDHDCWELVLYAIPRERIESRS